MVLPHRVNANKGEDTEQFQRLTRNFERYLTNIGVVVVKFFLNIPDDAMNAVAGKRAKREFGTFLTDDHIDSKKWRDKLVMHMIISNNTPYAPWVVMESETEST